MRLALLLLISTFALAGQGNTEVRNPRSSPTDIAAGANTFRSHCSPCHGIHGEGGLGPNLANGHFYHGSSDLDLLNNISDGIPGTPMPGLFYSPDRLWQVVAFIRSLNTASGAQIPGDAARGAQLFKSQGCTQCHRVNGEGGRLGPDLTEVGRSRSPEFLRESIVNPNADVQPRYWLVRCRDNSGVEYEGFLMNEDTYTVQFIDMTERLRSLQKSGLKEYHVEKTSKMPSYKDKLSTEQLNDLVDYLFSLRASGGSQ